MCLSIPARIVRMTDGPLAIVSIAGTEVKASLALLEEAAVGDYVLLHCGFAIEKISEADAIESLRLLREMQQTETGGEGE